MGSIALTRRYTLSLRLGDIAPDFEQDSSAGTIRFHEWLGDSWGVLFSHPADFTPVCTTELGFTAKLKDEFAQRGVKAIALSVDPVDSLQLTDNHKVATPANWQGGDEVVIVPSLKDEEEIKKRFAKGYRAVKPYLRLTPQPNR